MDNTQNQSDKDKLRVITAEEVLEELRRRKKEYGSVFLPTNSYQVIKNGKVVKEDTAKPNPSVKLESDSLNKSNTNKSESLRKAVLFLESFAFKKPLQSVFTVLMLLGITTGMYIATRPVGDLEIRKQADTTTGVFLGINDTSGTVFPIQSRPNIYCKTTDLDLNYCGTKFCTTDIALSTCLVKNITSTGLSKVIVLSKPDFLNFSLNIATGRVEVTKSRTLTLADQNKAYKIKLLGVPTDQSSYVLLNFTLKLTDSAQPTTSVEMKLRNPVGGGNGGFCEASDEANSKSAWKAFNTNAECLATLNKPVITTANVVDVNYETQCKNNPVSKTVAFPVSATDSDGDLTYFQVDKNAPNSARLETNLEQYIQAITSSLEISPNDMFAGPSAINTYSSYQYSNNIKLDLTPTDIGKTLSVKVNAINQTFTSYNTSKTFQVKVNEKVVGTNPNLSVSINTPKENDTVKGVVNIGWNVSNSCDYTRYKVEVWDKYCTTFKTKLTDEIYTQTPTKPANSDQFNTSWDTRSLADGLYCVRVFVRNSINEAWQVDNNGVIMVQNNQVSLNRSPSIISVPPSTNIKAGQIFNYVVKTSDADNDAVTITVDKKPDWLTLNGSTLSGSTTTTGKYDVSIRAKDSKNAYSVPQMFSITVSPANNTPSVIAFDAFPASGTISGTYAFKWTLTDSDGVKSQVLYISEDGTTWTKLAEPKVADRTYSFDTTKYKNGEYYMKLVVTDNKSDVVEKLTEKFVIDNTVTKAGITIASREPNTNAKITNLRPTISVKLVLPAGTTLDESKLVVTLDERVITSLCKYEALIIGCILDKDLELGSHKVTVEYYDNFGVKGTETWEFEVIREEGTSSATSSESSNSSSDTINILGRNISKALGILLLVLCIAGVLIFLVPLIIFRVWKKKDSGGDDSGNITPPEPTKNASYDEPVLSKEVPPAYSYNTKSEFNISPNNVDNSKAVENPNVSTPSVVSNTPTKTTYTNDEISSFQKQNKYDTVPPSSKPVDSNLSTPNTTWGLAERYKQPENTNTTDAGTSNS